MSGHSHWAGIKRKKGAADQKRGEIFSKLLAAITAAAKSEPNPDFNPRLRDAILRAKDNKVPTENIERAVRRASESGGTLEEVVMEAYGPGGVAILIEAATDNRNRAVAEVRQVLRKMGGKWAEPGSVRWVFEQLSAPEHGWRAKFLQAISAEDKAKLNAIVEALRECGDTQSVYTNAQ